MQAVFCGSVRKWKSYIRGILFFIVHCIETLAENPYFYEISAQEGKPCPTLPPWTSASVEVETQCFLFCVVTQTSPIRKSVATRVPSKCLMGFNAVHTFPCPSSPLCPSLYQHHSQACYPFFIYKIRDQITGPSHLTATVDVDSDLQILLYHFLHHLRREKERN